MFFDIKWYNEGQTTTLQQRSMEGAYPCFINLLYIWE